MSQIEWIRCLYTLNVSKKRRSKLEGLLRISGGKTVTLYEFRDGAKGQKVLDDSAALAPGEITNLQSRGYLGGAQSVDEEFTLLLPRNVGVTVENAHDNAAGAAAPATNKPSRRPAMQMLRATTFDDVRRPECAPGSKRAAPLPGARAAMKPFASPTLCQPAALRVPLVARQEADASHNSMPVALVDDSWGDDLWDTDGPAAVMHDDDDGPATVLDDDDGPAVMHDDDDGPVIVLHEDGDDYYARRRDSALHHDENEGHRHQPTVLHEDGNSDDEGELIDYYKKEEPEQQHAAARRPTVPAAPASPPLVSAAAPCASPPCAAVRGYGDDSASRASEFDEFDDGSIDYAALQESADAAIEAAARARPPPASPASPASTTRAPSEPSSPRDDEQFQRTCDDDDDDHKWLQQDADEARDSSPAANVDEKNVDGGGWMQTRAAPSNDSPAFKLQSRAPASTAPGDALSDDDFDYGRGESFSRRDSPSRRDSFGDKSRSPSPRGDAGRRARPASGAASAAPAGDDWMGRMSAPAAKRAKKRNPPKAQKPKAPKPARQPAKKKANAAMFFDGEIGALKSSKSSKTSSKTMVIDDSSDDAIEDIEEDDPIDDDVHVVRAPVRTPSALRSQGSASRSHASSCSVLDFDGGGLSRAAPQPPHVLWVGGDDLESSQTPPPSPPSCASEDEAVSQDYKSASQDTDWSAFEAVSPRHRRDAIDLSSPPASQDALAAYGAPVETCASDALFNEKLNADARDAARAKRRARRARLDEGNDAEADALESAQKYLYGAVRAEESVRHVSRASLEEAVDLVTDPMLFTYRHARSIATAEPSPFAAIRWAVRFAPRQSVPRNVFDTANETLRRLDDGSLLAEFRAHELNDG
ncbi:hypothetical protein M885DRAFT_532307 [Pelagophyceae sp. CCMP2097]|nr:hypothetical protein M885DRAFT_532307 [Pelagophyceae sp. CCMP2097]